MVLTAILDIAWVFGSGIYSNYIAGSLDPVTIAGLWALVIVSQTILLNMLTRGETSWRSRALLGALQGFTVYAVYNITAKVVFPSAMWPTNIALTDTLWGTLLFSLVAALTTPDINIAFNPALMHPASIMSPLT